MTINEEYCRIAEKLDNHFKGIVCMTRMEFRATWLYWCDLQILKARFDEHQSA